MSNIKTYMGVNYERADGRCMLSGKTIRRWYALSHHDGARMGLAKASERECKAWIRDTYTGPRAKPALSR